MKLYVRYPDLDIPLFDFQRIQVHPPLNCCEDIYESIVRNKIWVTSPATKTKINFLTDFDNHALRPPSKYRSYQYRVSVSFSPRKSEVPKLSRWVRLLIMESIAVDEPVLVPLLWLSWLSWWSPLWTIGPVKRLPSERARHRRWMSVSEENNLWRDWGTQFLNTTCPRAKCNEVT